MMSNGMQSVDGLIPGTLWAKRPSWVAWACFLALIVGGALPGLAQEETPQLVVDLEPGQEERSGFAFFGSGPVDGRLVFWADDGRRGRELWITDGTESGTRLWTEICPGDCRGDVNSGSQFWESAFDGERTFFLADDGIHGRELWTFDETMSEPRLVADLCPGACNPSIRSPTLIGDRLYFAATGPDGLYYPWVSDGTAAGTEQLLDQFGGSDRLSRANNFLPLGDGAAFTLRGSGTAVEWWATDGTPTGTRQLTDRDFGSGSMIGLLASSLNGNVVLGVSEGPEYVLYRLSPEGHRRLATLCEGTGCLFNGPFRRLEDRIYIPRGKGVWSTDGTVEGTRLEVLLPNPLHIILDFEILDDGTFLVLVREGVSERRVYRRVGTSPGELILELGTTAVPTLHGLGSQALVVESRGDHVDVWSTDGTVRGTQRYLQIETPGGEATLPFEVGDRAVFAVYPRAEFPDQAELVATGGPQTDLVKLWQIEERPAGSRPQQLTSVGPRVVFRAEALDDPLDDLWSLDRFGITTQLGVDMEPEDLQRLDLTEGPRAFFTGIAGTGVESGHRLPWMTDGTLDGTFALNDPTGTPLAWGREPVVLNGQLFFLADEGAGQKLWKTGVDAQTVELVVDLQPGYLNVHIDCEDCSPPLSPTPIFPRQLTALGQGASSRLVFVGGQNATGAELWQSDGTAQGTSLVFDLRPGEEGSEPEDLLPAGSGLLFTADAGDGRRLYFWDGQSATPSVFMDMGELGLVAHDAAGAVWIVRVDDRFHLWASDGTSAGTKQVLTLPEGVVPQPSGVLAGNQLFFAAADEGGAELWTASLDVSTPEVQRVADLWPGHRGSFPEELRLMGDQLYFSADNGSQGRELWRVDLRQGTLQPQPVGEVAPGVEPSSPRDLARLETPGPGFPRDSVLFTADDGVHGRELWSVPFLGNRSLCESDATTLCLRQGRFRVTVSWRDEINGTAGVGRVLSAGDETGFFWFFGPDNLELIVKVIDGRDFNDAHWFFYGALSDVAYDITVEDLATGAQRIYSNSQGNFCGQGDIDAFPETDAGDLGFSNIALPVAPAISEVPISEVPGTSKTSGCVSQGTQHCLLERFEVTVDWTDHDGNTGQGQAALSNGQTGLFWFFDSENIELAVKAIDGTDFNDSFWIFYGALTDVEYALRVVDTFTGNEVVYQNPAGNLCGRGDTSAFPLNP